MRTSIVHYYEFIFDLIKEEPGGSSTQTEDLLHRFITIMKQSEYTPEIKCLKNVACKYFLEYDEPKKNLKEYQKAKKKLIDYYGLDVETISKECELMFFRR